MTISSTHCSPTSVDFSLEKKVPLFLLVVFSNQLLKRSLIQFLHTEKTTDCSVSLPGEQDMTVPTAKQIFTMILHQPHVFSNKIINTYLALKKEGLRFINHSWRWNKLMNSKSSFLIDKAENVKTCLRPFISFFGNFNISIIT